MQTTAPAAPEKEIKTRNKSEHLPEKSLMCLIEALLLTNGYIERREILALTPISGPAATKLLAKYRKLIPKDSLKLTDKGHSKQYIPSDEWHPIFLTHVDAKTFLRSAKLYLAKVKANPRHALIESMIEIHGSIKRADLLDALDLKRAMGTNMLAEYVSLNAESLQSDGSQGYKKSEKWTPIALPAFRASAKNFVKAAEIFLCSPLK